MFWNFISFSCCLVGMNSNKTLLDFRLRYTMYERHLHYNGMVGTVHNQPHRLVHNTPIFFHRPCSMQVLFLNLDPSSYMVNTWHQDVLSQPIINKKKRNKKNPKEYSTKEPGGRSFYFVRISVKIFHMSIK